MTFSRTKIYNIALHNLGVSAPIQNSNQNDPRAILLNNYYEVARDTVLEAHEWSFANAFKELSTTLENSQDPNFRYAFTDPNDCISPRAIISPYDKKEKKFTPATNSNGEKIILTNHNPCRLRYTRRVDNEAFFSAAFVNALAFYLAYLSAQVITGSSNKKNTNFQDYTIAVRQAIVTDARKNVTHNQDDKDFTDYRD